MGLGGLISSIGSFGRRSMIGAGVGGAMGFANTGDLGGVLGGAAGGAAFGGLGYNAVRNFNYGGLVGKGMNAGIRGLGMAAGTIGRGATKFSNPMVKRGFAMGGRGARMAASGAIKARAFMGNNVVSTNKWAGRGAAAMGLGSAAYIGSSVISSNRGY